MHFKNNKVIGNTVQSKEIKYFLIIAEKSIFRPENMPLSLFRVMEFSVLLSYFIFHNRFCTVELIRCTLVNSTCEWLI